MHELKALIETDDKDAAELLRQSADEVRQKYYGRKVFLSGLIEVSSYCKNDCLYCGIRRSNKDADRYRLDREKIFQCAENGYGLGFRTFVMQGGEDGFYTDDFMCDVISGLREKYPDCAITLSLGERSEESYRRMKEAGADRYLLRHEAASDELYSKLHPAEMSLENRKQCLFTLKKLGYQVGSGFMVGAPYQTTDHLCRGLAVLAGTSPAYDRYRAFRTPSLHPICAGKWRHFTAYPAAFGYTPAHVPEGTPPGNYRSGYYRPKRQGTWSDDRLQCGHAQPFAGKGAEEV